MSKSVNPFYSLNPLADTKRHSKHRYAKLPVAPRNSSPVPHLTSLYHFDNAGHYGDRTYPGNCGGGIIRDLLLFFQPERVFDPMTGSGTCADVCRELSIPCHSEDIRDGFDAMDPQCFIKFPNTEPFDFVWAHPPYWRQKIYTAKSGDLSGTKDLHSFLSGYSDFIKNCAGILAPGGKFAILMSDYHDREIGYVPLTYHTKRLAFAAGLRPSCTDIISFRHRASSSWKTYHSSFIPGLHDVCMIFEKP